MTVEKYLNICFIRVNDTIFHTEQSRSGGAGMNAEIIAIGDEVLLGQIQDTNSRFIAQTLLSEGIAIQFMSVIPDASVI